MPAYDYLKDPDDVDEFPLSWARRLTPSGDTIVASEWVLPETPEGEAPLVEESSGFTGTATYVWLSGGEERKTYRLTNRVTTAQGRRLDYTVVVRVQAR